MTERYKLTITRSVIGWWCEFGSDPDNGDIPWSESPASWRLTRRGAIRWGQRRRASRDKVDRRTVEVISL